MVKILFINPPKNLVSPLPYSTQPAKYLVIALQVHSTKPLSQIRESKLNNSKAKNLSRIQSPKEMNEQRDRIGETLS